METRYTATVYSNNHIINSLNDNELEKLVIPLLVKLNESISGSYGLIRDNRLGVVVQRYTKTVLDD